MAKKGNCLMLYVGLLAEAEKIHSNHDLRVKLEGISPEIPAKIISLRRIDALARHWEENLLTAPADYKLRNHDRTREGVAENYFAKLEDTILPEVEKAINLKAEVKQKWSTQREKTNQKEHSREDDTSIGY